jgi:capsular polysaccharide transport system permease protein
MNELGHRRAREQVAFLEKQVAEMSGKALQTRQELLVFQNQKGMLSPQSLAETLLTTVNRLEAQLTDLKARRSSLLGYLSPSAPGVVEIDMQINGIEKQLQLEQSRLTSPKGQTLNRTVEEYQRLEMTAKFAEDVYKTALVALEKGRIEALRTLKKVSVLQSPTLPQYPLEPRRLYNIAVFIIMALILAGIVHLLAAIIRDHRD